MKLWLLNQLHLLNNLKKGFIVGQRHPYAFTVQKKTMSDSYHVDAAIKWLSSAQDHSRSDGVSSMYNLLSDTWGEAYRETTGYIIPTFIAYSKISNNKTFFERAFRMGDWEIKVQDKSGGVGEKINDGNVRLKIFNTGQVILGWCALFDETHSQKYLSAAQKAADWIIKHQDTNGGWDGDFSNNGAKTFDTRVAWALEELYKRAKNEKYRESAQKNILWAMSQQRKNGWFDATSLSSPEKPWTHLIAYTISGILKYSLITGDKNAFKSAMTASASVAKYFTNMGGSKFLPATFNSKWESDDQYSCLTGNFQFAVIWCILFKESGNEIFNKATEKMTYQMKQLQFINSPKNETYGGIAGSYPISGPYASYAIPNWGVKFFADMLIVKNHSEYNLLG